MALLQEIRVKFVANEFELSKHATDQSILREVSVQEIRETISTGEVIEDYPHDKYGPSCLIFGLLQKEDPSTYNAVTLHV